MKKLCAICGKPIKQDDSIACVVEYNYGAAHLECALKKEPAITLAGIGKPH